MTSCHSCCVSQIDYGQNASESTTATHASANVKRLDTFSDEILSAEPGHGRRSRRSLELLTLSRHV